MRRQAAGSRATQHTVFIWIAHHLLTTDPSVYLYCACELVCVCASLQRTCGVRTCVRWRWRLFSRLARLAAPSRACVLSCARTARSASASEAIRARSLSMSVARSSQDVTARRAWSVHVMLGCCGLRV
jgi:hypothetical protein